MKLNSPGGISVKRISIFAAMIFLIVAGGGADASATDNRSTALKEIQAWVNDVCGVPSMVSLSKENELSASVNGSLKKLVANLVGLGFSVEGRYKEKYTQGVLQKDLAQVLSKTTECKKDLAHELINGWYPSLGRRQADASTQRSGGDGESSSQKPVVINGDCNQVANGKNISQNLDCRKFYAEPPRNPAGLYQNGVQVGDVQGYKTVSQDSISFQALHFSAFVDPAAPIEIDNLLIHCADAPIRQPHVLVGQVSSMIAGASCEIVGRIQ